MTDWEWEQSSVEYLTQRYTAHKDNKLDRSPTSITHEVKDRLWGRSWLDIQEGDSTPNSLVFRQPCHKAALRQFRMRGNN